ncbi:hypothetical protein FOCC_FOCC001779 [Frankliniella occidentalis]|nr:hypothetical protein FOCC_FOCC001779 [Frankliniella occidentalis]
MGRQHFACDACVSGGVAYPESRRRRAPVHGERERERGEKRARFLEDPLGWPRWLPRLRPTSLLTLRDDSSAGVLSLLGRADQPPTPPLNLLADFAGGGLACAMGVLLALVERASSGRGQVVDAAMTEGVAYLASWVGRSRGVLPLWDAERGRNWLDSGAHFYDTYETRDGRHMAVGAIEPQFYAELLDKMGLEEEAVPQHGDWPAARQVLAERFRERTQAEWCSVFDGSDACVTPVLTLEEAARHPHNVARGAFLRPGEGHGGPTVPQPAPKLSRTPGVSRAAGSPADGYVPGKDTRRVLRELGYSDAQVQRLLDEGVAGVDEIGDLQAKL